MEKEKLCLRCMRKIGTSNVCPYCRNESSEPQKAPFLPLKAVVGGRYLIGKLVSTNSEGSTYCAFDLERKTPVTIRELFPKGLLTRGEGNYCLVNVGKASEFIDTKESSVNLWHTLSELKGFTALVPVDEIVEDLGTVYAVTEYLGEGKSLREYLLGQEQGYISWEEARVLFMPVLSAMGELHSAGIIHGGISPETLVVDKNGKLRITGFSISEVRRQKTSMECELFDGYAAVEQYGMSEGFGTATDIYAFAAVLYRALIGSTPMSSASRLTNDKLMIPGKFAEKLPAYVINALVNALQIMPEDRTLTAAQMRDELSASPAAAGTASEAYSSIYASHEAEEKADTVLEDEPQDTDSQGDEQPEEPQKLRKSTVTAFVISVVLCLAILIGVLVGFKGCSEDTDEDTTAEDTTEDTTAEEITDDDGVISINVPDFRGKAFEDIKNNETYKKVFSFKTEYVDSDEDKGTVISQNISVGTTVTSLNPRTVTVKISNGREVPDVEGLAMDKAVEKLKDAGFKNVEARMGGVADSSSKSLVVYRAVYDDGDDGWVSIPADRRLSVSAQLVIYYYGEYSVTVTEEETTQSTVTTTQSHSKVEASTSTTASQTTEYVEPADKEAMDSETNDSGSSEV